MPKISVIIPVYNVENYISQCVDSVLNQTFKDIEIILVNDGSTDKSGLLCDEYSKKDNRVKVIHKNNGGAAESRNVGINSAASDYIMFMDSDDFWNSNSCLEEINEIILKDRSVEVIMFDFIKFYDQTGKYQYNNEYLDRQRVKGKSYSEVVKYLVDSQLFKTSAVCKIIKREFLIENNIFFKSGIVAEDIDWGLNLFFLAKNYDVYEKNFYVYRQRGGSVTKTFNTKIVKDLWYVIKKWTINIDSNKLEITFKNSLMTYLSYHYSILMGMIAMMEKNEKENMVNEIKPYRFILNYSQNKKTKLVKTMYKITGFKGTMILLNLFLRLKKTFNY